MRIYDITQTLQPDMATWPGESGPTLTMVKQMSAGDEADISLITLGAHTGTHVDAPRHFIPGGSDVEAMPLSALVGPARVVDIPDAATIRVEHLEAAALDGVERVLFRTRNSERWTPNEFRTDFVHLEPDAALWLCEHGTRLVGIDYLSVEKFDAPDPVVHRLLLAAGVVILEGLDLRDVAPGDYLLCCLPLKLAGAEGAPARAVLIAG
jgi:arylformamidase